MVKVLQISGSDIINKSGIYDGGTGTETDLSQFELDKKDFIPLYFRNIVTVKLYTLEEQLLDYLKPYHQVGKW